MPGSQDIGGLGQAFLIAYDAYFIPVQLLQGREAGCRYSLGDLPLAQRVVNFCVLAGAGYLSLLGGSVDDSFTEYDCFKQ
ncbi:hypothetical protein ES703_57063 [subsurface metagenome]